MTCAASWSVRGSAHTAPFKRQRKLSWGIRKVKNNVLDWGTLSFCQKLSEAVQLSDNLSLPSDPERTLNEIASVLTFEPVTNVSGYHSVSVKGTNKSAQRKRRDQRICDFIDAGNTVDEAAEFFSLSTTRIRQILRRGMVL